MVTEFSVPSYGSTSAAAGAPHLRLLDLARPLKAGDAVALTLTTNDGIGAESLGAGARPVARPAGPSRSTLDDEDDWRGGTRPASSASSSSATRPGLTDAEGRLLGLFRIDPIDDLVHLLSGIAGALIAWRAARRIPAYFIVIGVLYNLDAIVGMTMSRGLLDLSVFTQGPGAPDFSLTNWALNLPHIVLASLALWIGLRQAG